MVGNDFSAMSGTCGQFGNDSDARGFTSDLPSPSVSFLVPKPQALQKEKKKAMDW